MRILARWSGVVTEALGSAPLLVAIPQRRGVVSACAWFPTPPGFGALGVIYTHIARPSPVVAGCWDMPFVRGAGRALLCLTPMMRSPETTVVEVLNHSCAYCPPAEPPSKSMDMAPARDRLPRAIMGFLPLPGFESWIPGPSVFI